MKPLIKFMRMFVPWYKDRDFPEIKSGNDDVVAVIQDPDQLERVIDSHNELLHSRNRYKDNYFKFAEFRFESRHFPSILTNDEAVDLANRILNEIREEISEDLKVGKSELP